MSESIFSEIQNRIKNAEAGTIFVTSDFTDLASNTTVRKSLGRLTEDHTIRRIIDGVYEKPVYSKLLDQYIPPDPDKVAHALARSYHWTIAPCGDVALNQLGLSTQVPVVWSYISDGPYRKFKWDKITLSFKHRANRQISLMSDKTSLVIEAIRTYGKDNIDDTAVSILRNRFTEAERKEILEEAAGTSEWIYQVIRRMCE